MDNALFDYSSWKRALMPAFRSFVYMTILYVLIVLLLYIPNLILSLLGIDLSQLFSWLSVASLVLAFFLSFFKVLDEIRPGNIQLDMA